MTEKLTDELIDAALMAAMDGFQSGAKSMFVDLHWKLNPAAFAARQAAIEEQGEAWARRLAQAAYRDRSVYELFRERVAARLNGEEPAAPGPGLEVRYPQ